jgi:hypothetical protein
VKPRLATLGLRSWSLTRPARQSKCKDGALPKVGLYGSGEELFRELLAQKEAQLESRIGRQESVGNIEGPKGFQVRTKQSRIIQASEYIRPCRASLLSFSREELGSSRGEGLHDSEKCLKPNLVILASFSYVGRCSIRYRYTLNGRITVAITR